MLALLVAIAAQSLNYDAVAIVGQSLANGSRSTATSTVRVGDNSVFTDNLSTVTKNCGAAGNVNSSGMLEPAPIDVSYLVEGGGLNVETPRACMAAYYYAQTGRSLTPIQSACGGASYASVKKGQTAFTWLSRMLESYGSRRPGGRVLAAVVFHGEQDKVLNTSTATYKASLVEWQADVEAKVMDVGAAVPDVPMLIAQTSSVCSGTANVKVIDAQWQAFRDNRTKFPFMVPAYPLTYDSDDVHLATASYCTIGAQFGKALVSIHNGVVPQSLYPTNIMLSGSTITASLHTPFPPLFVDTTLVGSVSNYGFSYTCSSNPPSITGVDCSAQCSGNTCTCLIALSGQPDVTCRGDDVLTYAWPTSNCTDPGPVNGARGNIRDSDDAAHAGVHLYNWLVHFSEDVS